MIGYAAVVAVVASACGSGSSGGSSGGGGSHRGGTMIMLSNTSWGTLDPAKNYTVLGFQSAQYVADGLVGFRRAGGVAGTQIVRDRSLQQQDYAAIRKAYSQTYARFWDRVAHAKKVA